MSTAFAAFAETARALKPRTRAILGLWPSHLEASRGGKLLGRAAEALASDFDILAAALAAIRRAHRLGEADEMRDLVLIGGLHGITRAELAVAMLRAAQGRDRLAGFEAALGSAEEAGAADALLELWGIAQPPPLLPLFAPPDRADEAGARLAVQARGALATDVLLDAVRSRIATIAAIHAEGNGTVRAVLTAAANALDLDIGPIVHSADRYWHAAPASDRWMIERLVAEASPPAPERGERLAPADEIVAIEENPLVRIAPDIASRRHGELFTVLRRGFDRTALQVRVIGELDHSVAPMLVNRDEGQGIGYDRAVPPGAELKFTEDGRALLDGADVTSFAFGWRGGCFAGADASPTRDFVFAGEGVDPAAKIATFVVAESAAAIDREAAFPSDGADIEPLSVAVGETRFAFFVRAAHFGVRFVREGVETKLPATPRSIAGLFDQSLFVAGSAETDPFAAQVELSWLDHEPFRARVLIPPRFRALVPDDAEGATVLGAVKRAIERVRPLGVDLEVRFIDDRWILGDAVLSSISEGDIIDRARSGTALWTEPAPAEPID